MKIFVLLILIIAALCVKHPTPYCRVAPFPTQIPISIGEQEQFDLQRIISGYNLYFEANNTEHVTLQSKYNVTEKPYGTGYNFVSVKVKDNNRFLGLISKGEYTGLAIGTNNQQSGVTIDRYIQIENYTNIQCFDMDEVVTHENQVVVVDCAFIFQGHVRFNQFIFVDILNDYKVIQSTHYNDVFVRYETVTKRRIQVVQSPFFQIPYIIRFNLMDGVDIRHKGQTYAQIFYMRNPLKPQLLDVIDHTFLQLQQLSIADYQIHNNLIYILAYNKGIYQFRLNLDQHIVLRSIFPIKLDINRFRVDMLGFNDDLNVVATNGNTIYQFQWDVTTPPKLIAKYNLIPNSKVNQIFVDYNFVIASVDSNIDDQIVRRTWVFTRRTLTYLNAYNVFHAPPLSDVHLIHWEQHGRTLQIFHLYTSYNIKLSLPYVSIKLVKQSSAGKTQNFVVSAVSLGDSQSQRVFCNVTLTFIFLKRFENTIIKTGSWARPQIVVDSPGKREISLVNQFFGLNLTFKAKFQTNSTEVPFSYNDKQHRAIVIFPPEIASSRISFIQMFSQYVPNEKQEQVFGLIQVQEGSAERIDYRQYYIGCKINLLDRDEVHHLTCRTINSFKFTLGKMIKTSHIFDPKQRRIAVIFDSAPHTVFVYFFWGGSLGYYGRKDYAGVSTQLITGVAIVKGKLFVVLQYEKKVQILNLEDIYDPDETVRPSRPRMVLNSQVMKFFGVQYFAPVDIRVSRFHHEIIFLKTKTGIMVINVNQDFIPLLLYTIPTINIRYDFQVTENQFLIINETQTDIYSLQNPLRRNYPPLKKQSIDAKFRVGQYDEVVSDKLFYIVGQNSAFVINPRLYSTSAFFSEVWMKDPILDLDAVNVNGKEILFIRTKNQLRAEVFAEEPKLFIQWSPNVQNFKMELTANNMVKTSQPYSLAFQILKTNQTIIKPTPAFNETQINQLGNFSAPAKNQTFSGDIRLNDSQWFQGTIFKYSIQCDHCNDKVTLTNHVQQEKQLVEARYIYDMESTYDGVWAQQYFSVFKTHNFNDSIHFINQIPVSRRGEVCNKIAVGQYATEYVFSLCEIGDAVNVYITSTVGNKPFTFGPYPTDAKRVNHAKIVGDMLMIIDNDDDPFARAGGVYLYHLNFDFDDQDFITFMDYIDYADLLIEGFTGIPYIGSADLEQPYFFSKDQQYRLFLTEAGTGAIFIFSFQVSADGNQLIYLSKKYISLQKFIPSNVKYPSPLRVQTITIHESIQSYKERISTYYLVLSVSNWHHIQLMIKLDQNDDVLEFKLERLFERFPWELRNFFRFKRARDLSTYFAVPYVDYQNTKQAVMVYWIPFIVREDALTYQQKYSQHQYKLLDGIPLLRAFGAHQVKDTYETAFAFHSFGQQKLLFTDIDGYNITELSINRNILIKIRDLPVDKQILNITAKNSFTNFNFNLNINFYKDNKKPDEQQKQQILWIIIVIIGSIMLIGLLIAFILQRKRLRLQQLQQNKQTLLTVDEDFKNNYIDINRSSADVGSQRQSVQSHLLIKQKPEE